MTNQTNTNGYLIRLEVLKMAKDIVAAQKKEIAELDAFLARSGKTPAAPTK